MTAGLTQAEVAEQIGLFLGVYRKVERGETGRGMGKLTELSRVIKADHEKLVALYFKDWGSNGFDPEVEKPNQEARINGLDVRVKALEQVSKTTNERLNEVISSQLRKDLAIDEHFDRTNQRITEWNKYLNDELKKQKNDFSDSIKVLWLGYAAVAVVEFILLCIILS